MLILTFSYILTKSLSYKYIKNNDYIEHIKKQYENNVDNDSLLPKAQRSTLLALYKLFLEYNYTKIDKNDIEEYYKQFKNAELKPSNTLPKQLINEIAKYKDLSLREFKKIITDYHNQKIHKFHVVASGWKTYVEKVENIVDSCVLSARSKVSQLKNRFDYCISAITSQKNSSVQMAHIYNIKDIRGELNNLLMNKKQKLNNTSALIIKNSKEFQDIIYKITDINNILPLDASLHVLFDQNSFIFLFENNNWKIKYCDENKEYIELLLKSKDTRKQIISLLNRHSKNEITNINSSTREYLERRWSLLEIDKKDTLLSISVL